MDVVCACVLHLGVWMCFACGGLVSSSIAAHIIFGDRVFSLYLEFSIDRQVD